MELPQEDVVVIKVGGSLFDLPDLGRRLQVLLDSLQTHKVLVVPGGGSLADCVRDWDRSHQLGEETAHWLAMRTLSVTAHLLAGLSPRFQVIDSLTRLSCCWSAERIPVVDSFAVSQDPAGPLAQLPASWSVTSDSIAAAIAKHVVASMLVMAKSIRADDLSPAVAAEQGIVDSWFPRVAEGINIEWVNLRECGRDAAQKP